MRYLTIIILFIVAAAQAGDYRETTFKGIKLQVYTAAPKKVELFWKDADGKPYKLFSKVQAAVQKQGRRLVFIMNAGIFEPGKIPSGLHVEKGKVLHPLNLKDGKGNFFLKPNGVFLVDRDGKALVLESREYARLKPVTWLAVQSGPLLMRNGKVHPKFGRNSPNRRHRNGVGVTQDGKVVFVSTEGGQKKYITLYEFAQFFHKLGCRDALFLDGDFSTILMNPEGKIRDRNEFAAMFAVTEEKK